MNGLRPALMVVVLLVLAGCGVGEQELGERIYQQGIGLDGRLDYRKGPSWLGPAGQGCAVCHGRRGEGRTVRAGKVAGAAPALTPAALAARGYDAVHLRRAITEGIDPNGRPLMDYMPRWNLSERESRALLRYLETL